MAALIKIFAVGLMAVLPGGLLVLSAFVLARLLSQRVRAGDQGPHRLKRAVANLTLREVWDQTRRSI